MTSGTVPLQDVGDTVEARVLLAALHQDPTQIEGSGIEHLTPAQWDRLVTLAGQQRVRPLLHRRLAESGRWSNAPTQTWQQLVDDCRGIAVRKLRMHAELSAILSALATNGIPAVTLKGAYLGPAVYQNVALREMNDIDVMVPRADLAAAVACVLGMGFSAPRDLDVETEANAKHHVSRLAKPGVVGIEIHWNVVPPHRPISIAPEQLWPRARPAQAPGLGNLSLSLTDTLLHLCCHTSYQHRFEFGLRPSCDIAELIGRFESELNWDDVVLSCEERGWSRGVALALRLAQALIGARVPDEVFRALLPPNSETALRTATLLVWANPAETVQFSPGLAALTHGSWRSRLRAIRRRVFVPRHELQEAYGTQLPGLWRLHWVTRLLDVVLRHTAPATQLVFHRAPAARTLAQRRNQLQTWMVGS